MIGMIGLGRTGLPLALNLIARGHQVLGYRRTPSTELATGGGELAKTPREIAERCDVILSCLPGGAMGSTLEGADGLLGALGPRHVVVELGSHPLEVKERARRQLLELGTPFLDGEISGTPAMTAARSSVILIAGEPAAAERALAVCRDGSDHARYAGAFGAATKLKLVANLLVAVHTVAAAEALLLVERGGLDVALAIDVLGLGAGSSTMLKQRAGSMAARRFVDPAPGPVAMLAPYLDPISALGAAAGAPLPLFGIAAELFQRAAAEGRGGHDIGCVIDLLAAAADREKGTES